MSTTQLPADLPSTAPQPSHGPDATEGRATPPWMTVASREIYVRLHDRTFIVSTLVTLFLILALAGLQAFLGNRDTTHTVAVTGPNATAVATQAGTAMHAADAKVSVTTVPVADEAAARVALTDGEADVWLHDDNGAWVLTSTGETSTSLSTAIQSAVTSSVLAERAQAAGTTVEALTAGTHVELKQLDGKPDNSTAIQIATFAFALLFYISAMLFGLQIAGSVVEEKQSRLVEIIATAIPVRHLLAGKVLGNSLLAFGQIAVFSIAGLVATSFSSAPSLLPGLTQAVVWFILFFVVGFIALASLYAVAGSLASRNEDLQSTTAPMTMIMVVVYMASFAMTGRAAEIASFVPIASVIAMPARILSGDTAWWEPVLALLVMAAFALLVILLAERIYRRSLMQTRGKLSWREGMKATD